MKQIKKALRKILKLEIRANVITQITLAREKYLPISETKETDIFITGYPKSGNTWMQNLISSLVYGIDGALLPDTLTQELVPDVYSKKYYKRFHEVCFFKSHELPHPYMKKVIYLVRDGRDAMASYYAMNKALGKKVPLEKMIVDGEGIYPSKWHKHIESWLENPYNAKILIIKYEDLVHNTAKELRRILDFIEIKRSDEVIERAVVGNSFQQMQRKEEIYGWNNQNWNPAEKFIRKGEVGSFKKEIPIELIRKFESESFDQLQYFNYY